MLEGLEQAERGQRQGPGADEGDLAGGGFGGGENGAELQACEVFVVLVVGEGFEAGEGLSGIFGVVG